MNLKANLTALDPIWDISTAVGSVAGNLAEHAPLFSGMARVASGVQKVANLATLPQLVSQTLEFKSDPSALNAISLIGAGCDTFSALHDIDVIDLGPAAPLVGACSNIITITTGGYDCIVQVAKREKYQAAEKKAITKKGKEYYAEKKNLCLLSLAKKIASISLAVLGLISLFFGSLPFFGVLLITGSVVYLALTIGERFYSKALKQEKQRIGYFS